MIKLASAPPSPPMCRRLQMEEQKSKDLRRERIEKIGQARGAGCRWKVLSKEGFEGAEVVVVGELKYEYE